MNLITYDPLALLLRLGPIAANDTNRPSSSVPSLHGMEWNENSPTKDHKSLHARPRTTDVDGGPSTSFVSVDIQLNENGHGIVGGVVLGMHGMQCACHQLEHYLLEWSFLASTAVWWPGHR